MSLIGMISCGPNWPSVDIFSLFYNWYLIILGFFIPTSIVIASNVLVFNVSRKRTNKAITRKRESIKERRQCHKDDPALGGIRKEERLQRKLTLLSTLMTLTFYLSWLPYAMFSLIVMSGVRIPQKYQMFAALFAKSATIANPILYIFFNKDINTPKRRTVVLAPKLIDQDTKMQNDKDFQTDFSSKDPWTKEISTVKVSLSVTIDESSEELTDQKHKLGKTDRKKPVSTSL